jgi:GMP synthase (glutamine-hydrolysing)
MALQLLVFQHSPWEGPGRFLQSAANRCDVRLQVIKVWQHSIPDLAPYDGLVVLGGSPHVDQVRQYPFLATEKRAIQRSLAEDRPYLGFCLGHQLLAEALGAKIGPNFAPSVGFTTGYLTEAGREHPVFSGIRKSMPLFKWHGQTVLTPLPRHLLVLGTSASCQVEALSVQDRPHLIGVQFDNHAADHRDVATWLRKDQKWLASLSNEIEPAAILAEAKKRQADLDADFDCLFRNFLSLLQSSNP